jgi:hypothetical protein
MDFIQELIQESTNTPPNTKVMPKAEPIFGMPVTIESPASYGQAALDQKFIGTPQQFSDPNAAASPASTQEAATQPEVKRVAETPKEHKLTEGQTKQKFSCYNPLGDPPTGLRPSQSCLKCRYFCGSYDRDEYSLDPSGHCEAFDFAVRGGYVCDSFASLKAYREKMEAEYAKERDSVEVSMFAEKPAAQKLSVSDIESGNFSKGKPKEEEVPETKIASREEILSEPTEPAKAVPEETVVEKKESIEYSDKELYSEAIGITKSRFKTPDSSIAQSFCNQRYKRLFKAKYGSLEGAFS